MVFQAILSLDIQVKQMKIFRIQLNLLIKLILSILIHLSLAQDQEQEHQILNKLTIKLQKKD